jgi:methyl-accepting chemotaxis protein
LRKRLTVGQKLSVSFGIVLVLTALLMYSSVDTARRLGGLLDTEVNENAKIVDLISSIKLQLREMKHFSISTQFSYAMGNVLQVNSSKLHNARTMGDCAACHAFGSVEENRQDFRKLAQQATKDSDQLLPLVHSAQARAGAAAIRNAIQQWQGTFERYLELVSKGDYAGGHQIIQDSTAPLMEKIDAAANQLEAEQTILRVSSKAAAARSVSQSKWTTGVLFGISLLCGAFLALAIREINRLLRQYATELRHGAARVSEEAEQVRQASQSLGQGASDQAASIEQTSAASEQVMATAHQNAEHSLKASQLVPERPARDGADQRCAGSNHAGHEGDR